MNESRIVIEERSLRELAEILREKSGTTQPMDIDEMVEVADGIGLPEQEELNVTENGEYTPETYGFSKVTVDVQPEREEISITENGEYIPDTYGFSKVEVDVQPTLEELSVDKNGEYTPTEYGYSKVIVNCPPPPPDEVFHLTDNINYMFCDSHWGWYLEAYKDKFTTSNITSMLNTFKARGVELGDILDLPFTLNVNNITSMASAFDSQNLLTKSPKIRGTIDWSSSGGSRVDLRCVGCCYGLADLEDLFTSEMLEGFKTVKVTSSYSTPKPVQFYQCRSLRKIPSWFYKFQLNKDSTAYPAGTYQIYSSLFSQCVVLDEAHNIPVWVCAAPATSNLFTSTFDMCLRLKDYTFETIDGQPIVANWKNQTINLYDQVGFATGGDYYVNLIYQYNSGITADKMVTDDASYQALKNDPDWFTNNVAYSRYDHDSAVRTINSLPDTSAYLATAGGTNTIKFKKFAGSNTDGGAIQNLTAEEIAVAAAKGWTVTLVN